MRRDLKEEEEIHFKPGTAGSQHKAADMGTQAALAAALTSQSSLMKNPHEKSLVVKGVSTYCYQPPKLYECQLTEQNAFEIQIGQKQT